MSVSLPNGSVVHVASGYGASKTMSAVSNANPAIATLEAGHDVSVGDFIEVTSGWSRLTDKIVRAASDGNSPPSSTDIGLEGIDTSSTTSYPAGSGTGSIREISGWTQLLQIMNPTSEGGEQQFTTYQFLEADAAKRLPTFKNPAGWNLIIADDPSLAGYILAAVANDDRLPRAVRITLPNSSIILFNALITLNKIPSMTVNEIMGCQVTLSFQNPDPVRYAS